MVILVDMDGVIADFDSGLLKKWDEKHPNTQLFDNGVRKSFYIRGGNETDGGEISKILSKEGFFENLRPMDGAIDAIREMQAMGHHVFIATSPGTSFPFAASEKYRWTEKHIGKDMLEYLVIAPAKAVIRGDILIDDKPEIPYEENAEWEHVLFDRPYNKDIKGKRRLDWTNWKDVLTELVQ